MSSLMEATGIKDSSQESVPSLMVLKFLLIIERYLHTDISETPSKIQQCTPNYKFLNNRKDMLYHQFLKNVDPKYHEQWVHN
jgi:hypothetical protein